MHMSTILSHGCCSDIVINSYSSSCVFVEILSNISLMNTIIEIHHKIGNYYNYKHAIMNYKCNEHLALFAGSVIQEINIILLKALCTILFNSFFLSLEIH